MSRKDVPQTYKQNLEDTMILQHLVALKIAFEKADTDKSGGLDMDEVFERRKRKREECRREGERGRERMVLFTDSYLFLY